MIQIMQMRSYRIFDQKKKFITSLVSFFRIGWQDSDMQCQCISHENLILEALFQIFSALLQLDGGDIYKGKNILERIFFENHGNLRNKRVRFGYIRVDCTDRIE